MLSIPSTIKLAIRNLLANKKRALLTMLGVIIGVMSVVTIMAIGEGAQSLIVNQIKKFGTNLVGVIPGKTEDESGPPPIARGIIITTMKNKDAELIEKIPNVVAVTPYILGSGTMVSRSKEGNVEYYGAGHQMLVTQDFEMKSGRYFSERDEKSLAKVAVIGQQIADKFFPNVNPIGQTVKLQQEHFKVVGVLEELGASLMVNLDNTVFVPLTTGQKLLLGIDYVHIIRLKVDDGKNVDRVISDIERTLRRAHHILDPKKDDFTIRSMAQALDMLGAVTEGLKLFLAAIAAISLIVGGIGIMNMMLITVTQRTREIGLRKAVGAKKKDIIIQFLMESGTITVVGGLLGIFIGVTFSALVALLIQYLGYDWSFIVTPLSMFLALSVSVLIGIIFGLYPAIKASKLRPIEALRYE